MSFKNTADIRREARWGIDDEFTFDAGDRIAREMVDFIKNEAEHHETVEEILKGYVPPARLTNVRWVNGEWVSTLPEQGSIKASDLKKTEGKSFEHIAEMHGEVFDHEVAIEEITPEVTHFRYGFEHRKGMVALCGYETANTLSVMDPSMKDPRLSFLERVYKDTSGEEPVMELTPQRASMLIRKINSVAALVIPKIAEMLSNDRNWLAEASHSVLFFLSNEEKQDLRALALVCAQSTEFFLRMLLYEQKTEEAIHLVAKGHLRLRKGSGVLDSSYFGSRLVYLFGYKGSYCPGLMSDYGEPEHEVDLEQAWFTSTPLIAAKVAMRAFPRVVDIEPHDTGQALAQALPVRGLKARGEEFRPRLNVSRELNYILESAAPVVRTTDGRLLRLCHRISDDEDFLCLLGKPKLQSVHGSGINT